MPNTKSAIKRMRTSKAAHAANKARKSRIRTAKRNFESVVASGDRSAGEKALRTYSSELDKAAKGNVIARNTASRKKANAAKKVAALR